MVCRARCVVGWSEGERQLQCCAWMADTGDPRWKGRRGLQVAPGCEMKGE